MKHSGMPNFKLIGKWPELSQHKDDAFSIRHVSSARGPLECKVTRRCKMNNTSLAQT